MKLFVPKEPDCELRVPLVPQTVSVLTQLGVSIVVESGLGATIYQPDEAYQKAGAEIADDAAAALTSADMIVRLSVPNPEALTEIKDGACYVGYMDPFRNQALIEHFRDQGVSALCVEMIPRTTIAQKMDALSSQASLGGYVAVLLAAERVNKIFPMMMTPAGTLNPAKVFIIGAGVAGLQAIATAKRMGARVEAFDTRPVVEEQVQSLGAKFVKVDLGETGQTKDGYAKQLTEEQLAVQREAMARLCAGADIVITTAQVFGRPAPRIITADMVSGMKPGSVIVDMAVETGGNVEGSVLDEAVDVNGVTILGYGNLPGRVPVDSSLMYSSNVGALIQHFWNKEEAVFELRRDDEILQGCLLTHEHEIVNERLNTAYKADEEGA